MSDNNGIGVAVSLSGIIASEYGFVGIAAYLASATVPFYQFFRFGFRDDTFVVIISPSIFIAKSSLTAVNILCPYLFKLIGLCYSKSAP